MNKPGIASSVRSAMIAAVALLCASNRSHGESFGSLTPSAVPYEREFIWPEGEMPDIQPHQIAAKIEEKNSPDFDVGKYRRPYIEWYAPSPSNKIDLCVLFVSGGGFYTCCDAKRMQPAIDRFVRMGATVASLTYRTPRPKGAPVHLSGWQDAQRAVRFIRSQAAKRGFSPDRIGATGISAGAKLVSLLATSSLTPAYAPVDETDNLPCNLMFAVLQAPAYILTDGAEDENSRAGVGSDIKIVPELRFDAKTCPMCMVQGGLDSYSPNGSTQIYRQLRRMNIPAELHLFADRTHGFHGDLNKGEDGAAYDHWFDRVAEFVRQMNFDGRLGKEVEIMSRFPDDNARASYSKELVWPEGKMPSPQTNQCIPYIEWHIPAKLATRAIQIIYSGGGYVRNNPDSYEAAAVRRFLNEKGMAVVTLKHRAPRPLGGLPKHVTAWQDLQRTVRIVRSQAKSRGLDPDRIGVMGSSAGGHLTLMGALSSRQRSYLPVDKIDRLPCNVQWAVAIYPAYALTDGLENVNANGGNEDDSRTSPEFAFDLDSCPVLFIHGDADKWAAMNSVKCWEQLRRMGIQCDLHTLAKRGHCFQKNASPGTGSYTWMGRIWEFMNHKGFNR